MENWQEVVSHETTKMIKQLDGDTILELENNSFISLLIADKARKISSRLLVVYDENLVIHRVIDDINSMDSSQNVILFEGGDLFKHQSEEYELQQISERMEVLKYLQETNKGIVCLSWQSLMNKVPPPTRFREEKLVLKAGMEISFEELQKKLTVYGFSREDFVSKPGDFSIRGGIVDVYGFGLEHPVRCEFWGNVIDSLRVFDVETQRSLNGVDSIDILPNFIQTTKLERQVCFLEYANEEDELLFIGINSPREEIILREKLNHSVTKEILNSYLNLLKCSTIKLVENSIINPSQTKLNIIEATFKDNLYDYNAKSHQIFLGYDQEGQLIRIQAFINDEELNNKIKPITPALHDGFLLIDTKLLFLSEHQIFSRYRKINRRHQSKIKNTIKIENPYELQRGDYVVHVDYGIGRFIGLTKIKIGERESEVVKLIYENDETLFVNVKKLDKIQKFSSRDGYIPVLTKLGTTVWEKKKEQTKKKIKDIARDLIVLYSKRKQEPGYGFQKDTIWQSELEASFMFEDTPDQVKTTDEVKKDMELPHPMDRLVCGDVGFGKTEIAVRAAFKAVQDGKQVAVLVPTTILAQQHYQTFASRMTSFPVKVDVLSRFRTSKQQSETVEKVKEGKVDILIGTHRILSKDILFKDLGLLVVDEEHRFGVADKEKIKALKVNVDVLAMSATPIPRTMQLSLMGARDISVIATPPPNRIPVCVEIMPFDERRLREIIQTEINRNGQIFFIHNRVKSIYNIGQYLNRVFPKLRIQIAHGQLPPKELEDIMLGFVNHEFDMLVSTNIIESGVDIPNANTIIINRADRFGLSELYQLKGRVGRSNKQGYCFLLTPPTEMLKKDAIKRLSTIEEFTELGSGFNVAMRDMDIRGAGNILGAEQSGFVNTIGFELYNRLLEESVNELKEEEFKELFGDKKVELITKDVVVESPYPSYFPENYIESSIERFDLYKRLNNLELETDILDFKTELKDRFGSLPLEADILCLETEIKLKAERIGIEKISIGALEMTLLFPDKGHRFYKSGYFETLLLKVNALKQKHQLKDVKGRLLIVVNLSGIVQTDPIKKLTEIQKILDSLSVI